MVGGSVGRWVGGSVVGWSVVGDFNKTHRGNDYFQLQEATNVMSQVVSDKKQEYYNNLALKLNNPKTYWSILKTFYNGKKIPVIPPLLINNKLVSNFKTKTNHFHIFFASHCTSLYNNSKIPGNHTYVTDNKLFSLHFEDSDIIKILLR